MKRRCRTLVLAGSALAACLLLTSCKGGGGSAAAAAGEGSSPGAAPAAGGTVNVLLNANFSHLDPARGFDGGVNDFYRLIYRTLTTQAASPGEGGTKVVGDLATNTGVPSDHDRTWTFTLKKGLYFQTGRPITSQDVKFGVERAWDPEAGIGSPYAKEIIAAPTGYQGPYRSGDLSTIGTPDSRTIVFHLKTSFPQFGYVVAQPSFVPFPRGTGAKDAFDSAPIASGPYKVAGYTPGSSLKLVRNPYWRRASDSVRAAKPDSFVFTFGLDPATIDQRMLAEQGDDQDALAPLSVQPATVARLRSGSYARRTLSGTTGCTTYMSLNTSKPHLSNLKVRQAVEYAVNHQTTVGAVGGSRLAVPATSILPPLTPGRVGTDVYATPGGTGDPAKARKLLAEAGLPHGFTMTLDVRASATEQATAVALQQALKQAGITLKINTIDTSTFYQVIGAPSEQHDAALTGWCPDWPGGQTFLGPLFDGRDITAQGNNDLSQLNDKSIEAELDRIAKLGSVDQQNAAYGRLDARIMRLAPIVPLNYTKNVIVVGSNIAGAYLTQAFSGGIDYVSIGLADAKK